MQVVMAPDSFKESIGAAEAAEALAAGWLRARPGDTVIRVPMADGGEGTARALAAAKGGSMRTARVPGPLGGTVRAAYAVVDGGETAVIEVAAAAGLTLVPEGARDPLRATSRGVGALLRRAIEGGARRAVVGLGGSGTNDGGAGMARALGYRFLDARGAELPEGGGALEGLERIDASGRWARLEACEILAACDVDITLCGAAGASRMFGPQKGASAEAVETLERGLQRLAQVIARDLGIDVSGLPGGGAAGGLGAGLAAFAGAELRPGAELVAEAVGLEARLAAADLLVVGEGRLDAQTLRGKAPAVAARLARKRGVPVIAFAGAVGALASTLRAAGISAAHPITPPGTPIAEACARTAELLGAAAERVARAWPGIAAWSGADCTDPDARL